MYDPGFSEEEFFLLGLTLHSEFCPTEIHYLRGIFGSYKNVYTAASSQLKKNNVSASSIDRFASSRCEKKIQQTLKYAHDHNVRIITIFSNDYPASLNNILEPPLILYCKGNISLLHTSSAAIVGARKCSTYSRNTASHISAELADNGINIVSGMALGIDACAHKAALDVNGKTTAVLACDVTRAYPATHKKLYNDICETGCIVSEYTFGTEPRPHHFPVRNRIVAGLCQSVVVIQAGQKSGTMITAGFAAEFSRNVWVVPGKIDDPGYKGSNYLIQHGAYLCCSPWDVLSDFNITPGQQKMKFTLKGEKKHIVNALKKYPMSLEQLSEHVSDQAKLYSLIVELEVSNIIEKRGGLYCLR